MELALKKACFRAMMCSATLPFTHPLHLIIKTAKRNPLSKHLGPIDQLLKIFKLKDVKFETINPTVRDWGRVSKFKTDIAKSREDSISFESSDNADFKAFSDGSGQEEGIGASAILYKKGFIHPTKEIQAYIGPKSKHNTYEVEAVGAILAIWIIRNSPETIGKNMSLYIENQAIEWHSRGTATPQDNT
jgi:hypothetical protein